MLNRENFYSIEKTFELYHYFLLLPIDVANYAESRIEIAKNKKIPTYDDLHPNTRFTNNRVISQLRINTSLLHYIETKKLNWTRYPELIKGLYTETQESHCYKDFMSSDTTSYEMDKSFILDYTVCLLIIALTTCSSNGISPTTGISYFTQYSLIVSVIS